VNLRIATFNLKNLDDRVEETPTLDERIPVLRPQLLRLEADLLCLQEVNSQQSPGQPRRLLALERLLEGTPYAGYQRVVTLTIEGDEVYDNRNLVLLSRYEIEEYTQLKHAYVVAPRYIKATAIPEEARAEEVVWERPVLYARILLPGGRPLHVVNLHLKSRRPTAIPGQRLPDGRWLTASGWAEGFFLSSIKRTGQALETRLLIDRLFDVDPQAWIAVCGDFDADHDEVDVEAILGDATNTRNPELAGRAIIPCDQTVPEAMRYSFLYHGTGKMLDHVLVSRPLLGCYQRTEIYNDLLQDETLPGAESRSYPASDHAPVLAEFALPES
jgi:endonuclease/exonuclease/phosphatase family metal-dependent hydrolase